MPNAWVMHVKQWAAKNNKAYGCAISDPECKSSYKKPEKEKKSLNKDLNSLENELKYFETHYYGLLNKISIIPSITGKRAKLSLGEKPTDYYIKYNKLKQILEKQTGKNYPILYTETEFKTKVKKNNKKQEIKQIITPSTNQTEIYKPPLKKKKGVIF